MKTILSAFFCLLALPLMAQDARVPRLRVPPPMPYAETRETARQQESLEKNITIRLHGTTTNGDEIDFSVSGIGPEFMGQQVIDGDTILVCDYTVSATAKGFKVSYSVGSRIKVATEAVANTTNYKYRDISISGTILCSAGRAHVLVRNGAKMLQLTITEGAGEDAK